MSLGYAEKLSYREDVGTVGMSEIFDPNHLLQQKIEQLALMIEESKHLVAFTGAGISTSCGIPDFRGPKGVWTLQHEGKGVPEASLPFHRAMPSLTHMALVELEKRGILKFVISQNVDSLHLRSGIPREKLAELHGNSFREICPSCGAEYLRDFEVETIGLKITPRRCSDVKCNSKLRDTVLDWEDALPSKEMNAAEKHCRMADVVLCLGTSLQITPACNLPLKCLRDGGKIVIVNLQPTPKDKRANLVIHGLVDKVVAGVMQLLNMQIPPYVRVDIFQVVFYQFRCLSERKYVKWSLRVTSVHGERAPLPFIKSVEVTFPERPELKSAILEKQPFLLKREMLKSRPFKMVLKVNFNDGCGCPFTSIEFPVNFQFPLCPLIIIYVAFVSIPVRGKNSIISRRKVTICSHATQKQTDSTSEDKNVVIQKLKDTAIGDECCGNFSLVEKKILSGLKKEIAIYAGSTNIVRYCDFPSSKGFGDIKWAGKRERKEITVKGKGCSVTRHEDGTVKKLKVC